MSADDRTNSFDDAVTRSDHTDPDDVHSLAERLRREARDARGGHRDDLERAGKVDTDPYAFDTAPTSIAENETPTSLDPELTPSAENAPELVAALAQFSGRALQEAKFQAASDGRGAARYAVVAVPARSHGVVDPNAGEVIVSPHTTQPFLPAAAAMPRPLTPSAQLAPATPSGPFAQPVREERVVTRRLRPGPAAPPDTTIPGLRSREGRARRQKVGFLVLGALVLVVAAVLLVRTVTTSRRSEPDTSMTPAVPNAQGATVTAGMSSLSVATSPATRLPPVTPATSPTPLASTTVAPVPTAPPQSVPSSTSRRPEPAPRTAAPSNPSVATPPPSMRPAPSPPATSAPPKPETNGKGDFVW